MRTALGYVHVSTDEQADSDRYGIEPVAVAEGFDKLNPCGREIVQRACGFA
jgi:hypothetical protein